MLKGTFLKSVSKKHRTTENKQHSPTLIHGEVFNRGPLPPQDHRTTPRKVIFLECKTLFPQDQRTTENKQDSPILIHGEIFN